MKIVLIDGSALIYRSHFAMQRQPLTTSHGEITTASFGTANAVVRLFEDFEADRVVCAFDVKGPTFRHEMYEEYKAHRPPTPPDLAAQIPRVRELLEAMDVPIVEKEGYEADDVIGTLARVGADRGHEMWIYSGDKDFFPLIRPGVSLLKPSPRANVDDETLDEGAVRRKKGVRPAQYRDVLALVGDKSDNVPGVPGIGEKTAVKLISTFESIDRLLENLDDKRVTPRQRKAIEDNREQLLLSRRLVTIDEHVDVDLDFEEAGRPDPWTEDFRRICRELEFRQLLERFDEEADDDGGNPGDDLRYAVIESVDALTERLAQLPRDVAWCVDTETTSLDPMRAELVGLSFSVRAGEAWYVPVAPASATETGDLFADDGPTGLPWPEVREALCPSFEDPRIAKVGQNLKYDQLVLLNHGLELRGVEFDTMIASYLLAPERRQHNMDVLADEELGLRTVPYKQLFEGLDTRDLRRVPLDRLAHYACEDADVTRRLYEHFRPQLVAEELDQVMNDLEIPLSQVLLRMEHHGVRLDLDLLDRLQKEWKTELDVLVSSIHEMAGTEFNLNSPKQLQVILFERLGLKPTKKTSTGYSTDVEVLTALATEHDLPAKLLEYRQLSKLLSTYVQTLPKLVHPETGCVHTSFNQAVAATGRLSSTDPNLQNIPIRTEAGRRIREAFVPREDDWSLLAADYSQIELRLMAHMSGDESLIESFRAGEDIHARTAALVNGVDIDGVTGEMRRAAKAINFGILYGMGARALGQSIGVGQKEAKAFIDAYFEQLPKVRAWIDETVERATADREVRTMFGRRRRLPELASKDPRQRSFGERIAVNTPIQGSAADLIKKAMIDLDARIEREGLPARLLLQVHDELVLEVRDDARDAVRDVVVEEMEGVADLAVPLSVDAHFGATWAEAHA
jgi:DNA polymerase-1